MSFGRVLALQDGINVEHLIYVVYPSGWQQQGLQSYKPAIVRVNFGYKTLISQQSPSFGVRIDEQEHSPSYHSNILWSSQALHKIPEIGKSYTYAR